MSITTKNFTAKKSSVSCLLSILLSATALTAPVTLVAPSFGMDTPLKYSDITEKMFDVLDEEVSKSPFLQVKEIQPTVFNPADNAVQKPSPFNLGHQQNAIYNVMYQLSQAKDFNLYQNLALHEEDPENKFLTMTTEKIRENFEFAARVILNGTEHLAKIDIAQRVFLLHSLTAYSIYSQAYREAFLDFKKNLDDKYKEEKNLCDDEFAALEAKIDLEKQQIEITSNVTEQKILKDIENNKSLLGEAVTIADKNSFSSMIQQLETQKRQNALKKSADITAQNKIVMDKKTENNTKLAMMQAKHNMNIQHYRTMLSFIFEGKGTSWLPGSKTAARLWNKQPTARTDYDYYKDFDLLIHTNEDLMPKARAKFFHALLKDFKDTTPNQIKRQAIESLLGLNQADIEKIKDLFGVVMESSSPKIEATETRKPDSRPRLIASEPSVKTNGSEKISTEEAKELTISREVTTVTDQVATAVVNGIEPKKKIEENEVVTDLVWTPNPNRKMTTTPDQKPQTYEMTNPKATILVSASTDQKKNGANTTAKNSVRYGRKKKG